MNDAQTNRFAVTWIHVVHGSFAFCVRGPGFAFMLDESDEIVISAHGHWLLTR